MPNRYMYLVLGVPLFQYREEAKSREACSGCSGKSTSGRQPCVHEQHRMNTIHRGVYKIGVLFFEESIR